MVDRHRIIFEPLGLSTEAQTGQTILEAALEREVPIRSDCGGQGSCAKCRVQARPASHLSPPSQAEEEELDEGQLAGGVRLACQTRILGSLTVILDQGGEDDRSALGKTGLTGRFPVSPLVRRRVLPAQPPPNLDQDGIKDLAGWLEQRAGGEVGIGHPSVWRDLSLPQNYGSELTLVEEDGLGLVAMVTGRRQRSLGLAVDLGTTTVAGYLCDLAGGQILAAAGLANPQRRYGEDVISRIARADQDEEGLDGLSRLAREAVEELIETLTGRSGADRSDIDQVVVVGNTTMEQLFLGLHPFALGRAPYLPVARRLTVGRAAELDLGLNPGTGVRVFPVISGYVGGDTVAAVLAEGLDRRGETVLIIDIGTNGELVLLTDKGLWATSCATGPALEGAHISCGIRAVKGAIHQVALRADGASLECRILGRGEGGALGLCGSGIIDAVACLRRAGIILPNGRFDESREGVEVDEGGVGRSVILVPVSESGTGSAIGLTLNDVRQVQLAKAALRVGIEFLLERARVKGVDRTVLTGAFGARFDWRNALAIGLLAHEVAAGRVEAVENAAGRGAILALLDKGQLAKAQELAGMIQVVELSADPEFNLRFAMATGFPEL